MTTHMSTDPTTGLLREEPVTIGGGILVLGNLIIGGLPLFTDVFTAEQVGYLNLVFSAVVALATAVIRHFTVSKAKVDKDYTLSANVVEEAIGNRVFAGPANELATGRPIRTLDTVA